MDKYLGIDFGDSYIGLALSGKGNIALPYKVIPYNKVFWEFIQKLIADEGITICVIGWPISLSGNENERTRATQRFIDEFKKRIKLPVFFSDERLSSKAAHAQGVKGRVDAIAAAEILQTHLDRHESRASI